MSRHRHVRSMNYEDEYYDDDDIYGHLVEDNYCISPGTAAQFTYNRDRNVDLANYMGEAEGIPEEEEEDYEDAHSHSHDYTRPKLNDLDNAKLNSCLEEVRNVLGEAVPEHIMIETIMRHGFKLDSSLNELLNQQDAPKPQREKRENRRNRSQGKKDDAPKILEPTVILKTPKPKNPIKASETPAQQPALEKENDRTTETESQSANVFVNQPKTVTTDTVPYQASQSNVQQSTPKQKDVDKNQKNSLLAQGGGDLMDSTAKDQLSTPKKERFIPPLPRSASKSKTEKFDLMDEYKKRQTGKDMINLVVIGHVDAGKSTLMGHLLYQLGNVNQRAMHKYEKESRKLRKIRPGHVDAGKSTLMGHLLYQLGNVNQRAMHKYEQESRKLGKIRPGHVDAGKSTLMGHLLYQIGNVNQRAMHKYEQESRKLSKRRPGHVDAGKSTLMGHLLYQLGNVNQRAMHKYEQESRKLRKRRPDCHVDAGKSTLMGHLLYQLGNVNQRAMHKYEQESRKLGKSSFAYAWVLDETEEERVRGVTMDIAQTKFETPHKSITLLDAPGHKDFIPNMITGTAQADVAILVVNATNGEFETGFESGGQTREHALLARSLGVSQVIVAVNKMDTVEWKQTRYDDIVRKLGQFLKQAGFKDADTSYIPVSGLAGENLAKPVQNPQLAEWYKGATLVEQIDKFKPVNRAIDKPLRMTVSDVFKGMGSGFTLTGKIVSGCVQNGDRVLVMPAAEYAMVKGISMNDEGVNYAFAGDHVSLVVTGIDITNVGIGSVVCDSTDPITCATRIKARVVLFNLEIPMTRGFTVIFHYQSVTEPAIVKRLVSQLNKSTGEVIKNKPKCLTKNSSAVIEIEFDRPVCVELYKENKELGRFMLRYSGHTIAAGLIEEVLKTKTDTEAQGAAGS